MITISLGQAAALYSTILLVAGIALWVYTEMSTQRYHRVLGKQFLWRCFYCAYTYLDIEAETVSRCPRCQSYNTREDALEGYVKPRHARQAAEEPTSELTEEVRRNPSHRKRPTGRHRGPRRHR